MERRKRSTTEELHRVKFLLRDCREIFVDQSGLGLLLIENALPIPLGVALTEFFMGNGMWSSTPMPARNGVCAPAYPHG